jgi:DNA-binding MarR family transcriptional regulator
MSIVAEPSKPLTDKQGQYLAFIHAYSVVMGRPPAEADLQRHFEVTPPTVHQMIVALTDAGWISRTAGTARSIRLAIDPGALPVLRSRPTQTIKTPVRRY